MYTTIIIIINIICFGLLIILQEYRIMRYQKEFTKLWNDYYNLVQVNINLKHAIRLYQKKINKLNSNVTILTTVLKKNGIKEPDELMISQVFIDRDICRKCGCFYCTISGWGKLPRCSKCNSII